MHNKLFCTKQYKIWPSEAVLIPSNRAQTISRGTACAMLAVCVQKTEKDQSPGLGFYMTSWNTFGHMLKLCINYALIMQKLCIYYANYANIMQKLCKNYAEIMKKIM